MKWRSHLTNVPEVNKLARVSHEVERLRATGSSARQWRGLQTFLKLEKPNRPCADIPGISIISQLCISVPLPTSRGQVLFIFLRAIIRRSWSYSPFSERASSFLGADEFPPAPHRTLPVGLLVWRGGSCSPVFCQSKVLCFWSYRSTEEVVHYS